MQNPEIEDDEDDDDLPEYDPSAPDDDSFRERVTVRVTPAEHEKLLGWADKFGVTVTDLLKVWTAVPVSADGDREWELIEIVHNATTPYPTAAETRMKKARERLTEERRTVTLEVRLDNFDEDNMLTDMAREFQCSEADILRWILRPVPARDAHFTKYQRSQRRWYMLIFYGQLETGQLFYDEKHRHALHQIRSFGQIHRPISQEVGDAVDRAFNIPVERSGDPSFPKDDRWPE